jgi:hypothetical protein
VSGQALCSQTWDAVEFRRKGRPPVFTRRRCGEASTRLSAVQRLVRDSSRAATNVSVADLICPDARAGAKMRLVYHPLARSKISLCLIVGEPPRRARAIVLARHLVSADLARPGSCPPMRGWTERKPALFGNMPHRELPATHQRTFYSIRSISIPAELGRAKSAAISLGVVLAVCGSSKQEGGREWKAPQPDDGARTATSFPSHAIMAIRCTLCVPRTLGFPTEDYVRFLVCCVPMLQQQAPPSANKTSAAGAIVCDRLVIVVCNATNRPSSSAPGAL